MFAVIETGGKQYKVNEGDVIFVEKLDVAEGDTITFESVKALSIGDTFEVGTPNVAGAVVKATVVKNGKGKKITLSVKLRPFLKFPAHIFHA